MTSRDALKQVRAALARHVGEFPGPYRIPRFLLDGGLATSLVDAGDPCQFFIDVIDDITSHSPSTAVSDSLNERDLVYLSFMRTFASLNGQVGTPLKQLAFLQHLRARLGVSVVICLPTGVIGSTNRKGQRGSPFAVSNPFDLDRSLADPLVPELSAITLYQALCQACQHLGMRTGSIVPMATLGIDSPLFRYFPELGYWWLASPGERLYAKDSAPWSSEAGYSPPAVEAAAARRFRPAPSRDAVGSATARQGAFHIAQDSVGQSITLANAFPDVLAAEADTYTWEDVSPIRYADSLAPSPAGVRPAKIAADFVQTSVLIMAAVIAWRYCELGERVLIIDVAPSVPDAVLETARIMCSFWPRGLGRRLRVLANGQSADVDADRLLAELGDLAGSPRLGPSATDLYLIAEELWSFAVPSSSYQAVTGPITPCVSAHSHDVAAFQESLRHHLTALADESGRSRHLAGVSNHDTNPPSLDMSRRMFLFYSFLPASTPLIFSGSEWGFEVIVNREFGFLATSRSFYPLPPATASAALFNDCACHWDGLDAAVPSLHDLQQLIAGKLQDYDVSENWSYTPIEGSHRDFLGYVRISPDNGTVVAVVWNFASVTRHAGLTLSAVIDVLSWPSYAAASDPADLALIPANTVTVLIAESIDSFPLRPKGAV